MFASCKKSGNSHASYWTFKGIIHYGDAFTLDYDHSLEAFEFSTADKTAVAFSSLPVKSGVYNVRSIISDSTQCIVYASIGGNDPYASVDQDAKVSVTVSNGKITAVYNNVSLKSISSSDLGNVSATLVEE